MNNCTYYITAPYIQTPIKVTKRKVRRIKRARRSDVPELYRKKRFAFFSKYSDKLKHCLSEIMLYIMGIANFIRKGF